MSTSTRSSPGSRGLFFPPPKEAMASCPNWSGDRCWSPKGEGRRLGKTCCDWGMLPGRPGCGKAPVRVDCATLTECGGCAMLTVTVGLERHPERVACTPPGMGIAPGMVTPTTGY